MIPLAFDGTFGWLHRANTDRGHGTAVVMCTALGRDARCAHRPLRMLADQFAHAGFPTLRFDYPGTGDSLDQPRAQLWQEWRAAVASAIDLVRQTTAARRVVLCGLRIGAALAAQLAAERDDIAGLILLAPVVVGRTFVRELTASSMVLADGVGATDGSLDVDGTRLSALTLRAIGDLDLRRMPLGGATRRLIAAPARSAGLDACAENWVSAGARIDHADFKPLAALLRDTFIKDDQPIDGTALIAWLDGVAEPGRAAQPRRQIGEAALRTDDFTETPLRFGRSGHLFGMHCRPTGSGISDLVVLITNTGGDPHYGVGRFGVELARRLADSGISSLRMDFAGTGDSRSPACDHTGDNGGAPEVPTHVYETDRNAEIEAAIDALSALGYRRFAAHGVCSGAYHALHAGLRDPRIGTLLLVNLGLFVWPVGETIETVSRRRIRTPAHYAKSLAQPDGWSRIWRGEVEVSAILRAQTVRVGRMTVSWLKHLAQAAGVRRWLSMEQASVLNLSKRHVRTLFVLGPDEDGYAMLEAEFGHRAEKLRRLAGFDVEILPGLDHLLSQSEMRRRASEVILGFLRAGDSLATGWVKTVQPRAERDLRSASVVS